MKAKTETRSVVETQSPQDAAIPPAIPPAPPPALPLAIQLEKVGVQRGGRWILRDVSLTVPMGATCALVGHSGSGKSTLLRVLEGYEFPTEGRARVLGETLGETDIAKLRRRVRLVGAPGMSSMGGERLDFPIDLPLAKVVATGALGHLVMYDDPPAAEQAAAEALLQALKLDPATTWGVASAGERTRALLARARMPMSAVDGGDGDSAEMLLLLDEPTSGLDPGAREGVVQAMETPAGQVTQVIVTHHIEELPDTTSLAIVLKEGRVISYGAAEAALSDGALSDTFGLPMRVRHEGGRWSAGVVRGK